MSALQIIGILGMWLLGIFLFYKGVGVGRHTTIIKVLDAIDETLTEGKKKGYALDDLNMVQSIFNRIKEL